jgi:hypothetical protein
MRRYDLISGAVFFLLGTWIAMYSWRLGLGSAGEPGPGFFPFTFGVILGVLGLGIVVRSRWLGREVKPFWAGERKWRAVLLAIALMVGYWLALPIAGFRLATALLMASMYRFLGDFSWKKSALLGGSTAACAYILFAILLKVNFPRGPWGL